MLLDRLFGFLAGSVLAGSALYYYVIDEYKVSNELLTEDIYVCQNPPGFQLNACTNFRYPGAPISRAEDRKLRKDPGGGSQEQEMSV